MGVGNVKNSLKLIIESIMINLQQKKVSPFPKSITPKPLFTGILKDLHGCGGFTLDNCWLTLYFSDHF